MPPFRTSKPRARIIAVSTVLKTTSSDPLRNCTHVVETIPAVTTITITVAPTMTGDFATLMGWADKARKLKIRTNADTPADAAKAREFGAEGIGLCRTEHMFFGDDRITAMREMILADTQEARAKALAKLLPFQKADFVGIFEAMDGLPVTIRLLDPPLHEFLPHKDNVKGTEEIANQLGVSTTAIHQRVDELHEMNPMMGFRGCRLPIVYPEIGDMQVRAIIEASIEVKKKGKSVLPEIMIPLVINVREIRLVTAIIDKCIREIARAKPVSVSRSSPATRTRSSWRWIVWATRRSPTRGRSPARPGWPRAETTASCTSTVPASPRPFLLPTGIDLPRSEGWAGSALSGIRHCPYAAEFPSSTK